MKVYTVDIPQGAIDKAVQRMQQGDFQARQVGEVIAPYLPAQGSGLYSRLEVAHRAADRLIQKMRLEKNIRMGTYPRWNWCGGK